MTAAAATCKALLEMEGQMLGNMSSLGRGRESGSPTHSLSLSLPIHVLDTAATSQDGSIFRMQGSEGPQGSEARLSAVDTILYSGHSTVHCKV